MEFIRCHKCGDLIPVDSPAFYMVDDYTGAITCMVCVDAELQKYLNREHFVGYAK